MSARLASVTCMWQWNHLVCSAAAVGRGKWRSCGSLVKTQQLGKSLKTIAVFVQNQLFVIFVNLMVN